MSLRRSSSSYVFVQSRQVTQVRPLETLQAIPIFVVVLYKYYIHESIPRCHREVSKPDDLKMKIAPRTPPLYSLHQDFLLTNTNSHLTDRSIKRTTRKDQTLGSQTSSFY
jgi:hypothetical protein